MVSKKTCAVTAIAIATVVAGQSIAADTTAKTHIYDSAKHTRIYFPSGADSFADEVVDYKVGKKKPPHLWENADASLGAPNFKDYEGDRLSRHPSFAGLGALGSITLRFVDNAIVDGNGPDLYIFEPLENSSSVKVEVSRDGKTWIDLGPDTMTNSEIDIADKGGKNAIYNFVRITDHTKSPDPADQWPGADIDAVGALNSAAKISILDHALCPAQPATKKKSDESTEPRKTPDEEFKKVVEKFGTEHPSKLIVEVYSDTHDPKEHHTGATEDSEPAAAGSGPSKESTNANAKSRAAELHKYLTEAKLPEKKIEIDYFDKARSIARRDVVKEHDRDNRFDFVFLPYDRDTVIGDKTGLRNDHASKIIDGKWESELGEVILITRKDPSSNKVSIVGEWHENPARKGLIQSGTYDPATQQLNLTFYRTWSNLRGSADFKLSFDSARLKGKWKGDVGGSGDWNLIRKN